MGTFDWKWILGFVVALAAAVTPVVLWQADQPTKSIKVEVVSRTALNPEIRPALPGLQLTFEGKELKDAYLTVLELSNDGTRPILQADFESPLQLQLKDSANQIVRVELSEAAPVDLKPSIGLQNGRVQFQPMLLNPKDLVRISLVSVGGKPQFDIRSRIAGVSKIELKDEDLTATSNQKSTKRLTVGLLLLSVYAYLFFEFATSLLQRQFKLSLIAAALICNTGGGFLLETVGVNAKINAGEFYSYLFVTVAVTALFYFLINIRLMRRLFGSKKAM